LKQKNYSIIKKILKTSFFGGLFIILSTTFTLFNVYIEKEKNNNIKFVEEEIKLVNSLNSHLEVNTIIDNIINNNSNISFISIIGSNEPTEYFFKIKETINGTPITIFYNNDIKNDVIKRLSFRMGFVTIAFILLVLFITRQVSTMLTPFNKILTYLDNLNLDSPTKLSLNQNKISSEFLFLQKSLNLVIEKLMKYSQKIHKIANQDFLTQLNNRYNLDITIKDKITKEDEFSIVFIDIDNFKNINDEFGHDVGDEVLIKFSSLLQKYFKNTNLYRIGGDEFIILLETIDKAEITTIINDFFSNIKIYNEGNKFAFSLSIGISQNTKSCYKSAVELLKEADIAMYEVKNNTKDDSAFFKPAMLESILKTNQLDKDIIEAIDKKEFFLHIQPKYNTYSNKITGMEALIRWKKDDKIIYPNDFIDYLENSKHMIEVGYQVIDQSCKAIKKIKLAPTNTDIKQISINVSATQFFSPHFIEKTMDIIINNNCKPEWIDLEITERIVLNNFDKVNEIINCFKTFGVTFSLDDFGTEYSSLALLQNLNIDTLKIDKTFIDNLDNGIVEFIINLSQKMNLNIIAEGVETEEQLNKLKSINCFDIQGYFISKPIVLDELEKLIIKINNPSTLKQTA
jgi:diguanylate cyclase (GGDEF)-like protein